LKTGIVYLIGAGPGDPGLITVKGLECLRRADVVVYDYLANPAFLNEAPPEAERIYVGKKKGFHHQPQDHINALLEEKARAGLIVARLKGGDPYVFGRGGEEALHLHNAGIPFEVVPGVTAGFAAAAYAGIPLTHRDYTTSLGLVTGHEDPAKKMSSLDWEKLATGVGTLVFYMGMANLPLITEELIAHGRPAETPVAIVRWATTPRQQTLTATLGDVVEKVREAGIKPPAVIIVGEVVELREKLRWFDNRPLFGKRVMVTRTPEQAREFIALLALQGAEAVCCPTIATAEPESWSDLDAGIAALDRTDFLILTSTNAVDSFFARLAGKGADVRSLAGVRIVAVGPKTAGAIRARGISPDLVPEEYRAEGVVALLKEQGIAGKRILYPRADLARDLIPAELAAAGAVIAAPVAYRTVAPIGGGDRIRELLTTEEIDAVTFTSSSTVENFLEMVGPDAADLLEKVNVVSIGPLTTLTAERLGLNVAVQPQIYTLEGMMEAMVDFYAESGVRIQGRKCQTPDIRFDS
jgi:uroporphyrinogen III methyltransferase/synthase